MAISVTTKFQADLGNVSPDMVRLSLFSHVCTREGTIIGRSFLDLPTDMGNDVRGKKCVIELFHGDTEGRMQRDCWMKLKMTDAPAFKLLSAVTI